jgi:hypothetical protein
MSLISTLQHLPDWAVYVSLVSPATALAAAAPLIGRKVLRISPEDDRSRGAIEAFKAIVASLGFLLAFTLVQAQGTLQSLEKTVAQEAAALNTIDRSLLRYGSDDFIDLRASLHELVARILTSEWPALASGQRDTRAEAIVDLLSRRIRTTEATSPRQQSLQNELVAKLDEFTDRREELINGINAELPNLFWNTVGALLGVMGCLALCVTPTWERVMTLSGVTAASMLILSLIVITDAPFAGGAPVSAGPIEKVARLITARQKDPPPLAPAGKP